MVQSGLSQIKQRVKMMAGQIFRKLLVFIFLVINMVGFMTIHRAYVEEHYNVERLYYIVFHSNQVIADAYVNDIKVRSASNGKPYQVVFPISANMLTGKNQVSVNYIPVNNDLMKMGIAHSDAFIHIGIEARNINTQETERITLLDVRLDLETGYPVNNKLTIFNEQPNYTAGFIETDGEYTAVDTISIGDAGDETPSIEITMSFSTKDHFARPLWLDSTVLKDTPKLRKELHAAYKDIFLNVFKKGDYKAFKEAYNETWSHVAKTMGYKDAEEFGSYTSVEADLNNREFEELYLENDPAKEVLEFAGNGRLVRIQYAPIRTKGNASYPMFWRKTKGGKWVVGDGGV